MLQLIILSSTFTWKQKRYAACSEILRTWNNSTGKRLFCHHFIWGVEHFSSSKREHDRRNSRTTGIMCYTVVPTSKVVYISSWKQLILWPDLIHAHNFPCLLRQLTRLSFFNIWFSGDECCFSPAATDTFKQRKGKSFHISPGTSWQRSISKVKNTQNDFVANACRRYFVPFSLNILLFYASQIHKKHVHSTLMLLLHRS